ncbi:MAG: hypothetical protein LBR64_01235 [Dysgonamonadaceae bacterium]|jgi:hypothetical protein|nr:hypothetical protein [Dysgonamonadaceae bacterium]
MKFIWLIALLTAFSTISAFDEISETDIRALSLGRVNALSNSLLNPASLSFNQRKSVELSVFNRFEMEELSTETLSASLPNRFIDAGFQLSAFGYEDYQLLGAKIGLAKRVSQQFAVGVSLGYMNESSVLLDVSNKILTADAGLCWKMSDKFDFAFSTKNLLHSASSMRRQCFAGILYRLSEAFNLLLEGGSDFEENHSASLGADYLIADKFNIRLGFNSNPKTPSLGFGYRIDHFTTDVCFLLHPVLGLSSGISVNYNF